LRRDHRVNLRFGDDEMRDVVAASAAVGLSPAAWAGEVSVAVARELGVRGAQSPQDRALLMELLVIGRRMAAMGNNVNQIARAANAGVAVTGREDLAALAVRLDGLAGEAYRLVAALDANAGRR
jgi:hypothetical protein